MTPRKEGPLSFSMDGIKGEMNGESILSLPPYLALTVKKKITLILSYVLYLSANK